MLNRTFQAQKQKGWDWRLNLLLLCVILTEALWVGPLLQWLLILFDDPFPMQLNYWLSLIVMAMLAGLVLRRVLLHRRVGSMQQSLYLLLGFVITLLATVSIVPVYTEVQTTLAFDYGEQFDFTNEMLPNGIILAPIIFMLFMRGASIARATLTAVGVGILVRFGILMFFITALFAQFNIGENVAKLREDMLTVTPLFFFTMLIASGLGRAATLKIEEETRRKRFGLPWLGFLTGMAALVTTIGFVLALLLAGIDRDQALQIITLPLKAVIAVLFVLATPVFFVAEQFIGIFTDSSSQGVTIEGGEASRPIREGVGRERLPILDTLEDIGRILGQSTAVALLVIGAVIVIGFWVLMFFANDDNGSGDENSETVEEREGLADLPKAFLRQLRKLAGNLGLIGQYGVGRDLFTAFTIRWAYGRMERMGRKRGFGRSKSQTPYEYRHALYKAFPGANEQVRTITDAYVAIRYGELPENDNQLQAVKDALEYLKAVPAPQ